jgi:alcohol dehydrogenase class IV
MPPPITASTGLDAFAQLLEAFTTKDTSPLTDGICREGLKRAAGALERAFRDGDDIQSRQDMCLASLFGGLALANAKLGAVHGIAGPLGGMFTSPHGAVCGRLLPYVMATNVSALKERLPKSPALARYDELARIVLDDHQAVASDGIHWVQNLCRQLQTPPLSAYGISAKDFPDIIEKSQNASSMRGNPIELTAAELQAILEQAIS